MFGGKNDEENDTDFLPESNLYSDKVDCEFTEEWFRSAVFKQNNKSHENDNWRFDNPFV